MWKKQQQHSESWAEIPPLSFLHSAPSFSIKVRKTTTPLWTRSDQYIDSSSEYNIERHQWPVSCRVSRCWCGLGVEKTTKRKEEKRKNADMNSWCSRGVKDNMLMIVDDFLASWSLIFLLLVLSSTASLTPAKSQSYIELHMRPPLAASYLSIS